MHTSNDYEEKERVQIVALKGIYDTLTGITNK